MRNHLPIGLGNCGQDMNGESIGHGHVGRDEVRAQFHQIRDVMDVTGQAIELCDEESRLLFPAGLKRRFQLQASG